MLLPSTFSHNQIQKVAILNFQSNKKNIFSVLKDENNLSYVIRAQETKIIIYKN